MRITCILESENNYIILSCRWLSIAATTVAIRIMVLPVLIFQMKATARLTVRACPYFFMFTNFSAQDIESRKFSPLLLVLTICVLVVQLMRPELERITNTIKESV